MWLLDTETLSIKSFLANPPSYAILSHTWLPDDSEVTFADLQNENKTIRDSKAGFKKIKFTCEQAKREGILWAWVDTCCINKDSSAELSEAINSMFKWYKSATTCYAYLEDFPYDPYEDDNTVGLSALQGCKWFSRGWTLQELVAPKSVVFFAPRAEGWVEIGTKESLFDILEQITRIPREILLQQKALDDFSVAARMSWAAGRQTTREEDTAYCLLGLFGVNMPLLYGEGMKAFIRLQEEIVRGERDDSLFAWCSTKESAAEFPYRGLFASSPEEFAGSSDIEKLQLAEAGADGTTSIIGNGRVSLSCGMYPIDEDNGAILSLNCYRGKSANTQAIVSSRIGFNTYLRSKPSELVDLNVYFRRKHPGLIDSVTNFRPEPGRLAAIPSDLVWFFKQQGLLDSPPEALALHNITIEKHVLRKTAITAENQVFRNDEILLNDLPSKFRVENVHIWQRNEVHVESTSMRTYQESDTQTVPVSEVFGNSMAFEISIKGFCVEIDGHQTVASGRFLLIFWVDAIPGSKFCTFHLDAKIVSKNGAVPCLMSADKPPRFNRSCKLVFGDLVVCITSCRRVMGSSRAICPRLTVSARKLSKQVKAARSHSVFLKFVVVQLAALQGLAPMLILNFGSDLMAPELKNLMGYVSVALACLGFFSVILTSFNTRRADLLSF